MAILSCCRFSIFTSPKFKSLPLPLSLHNHYQNPSTPKSNTLSYSYSHTSSSSSMDSPPQGYRRNVGVCLINPYKKVCYIYLFLLYMGFYMCMCCWIDLHVFLFLFLLVADFCSFKVGYKQCLANAAGSFFFLVLHWGVVIWLLLKLNFCVCYFACCKNIRYFINKMRNRQTPFVFDGPMFFRRVFYFFHRWSGFLGKKVTS